MMHSKLFGSILLIVGTSIGAGMLALPLATAQLGFLGSIVLLFACWFVMTIGALYVLEANLWLPLNSHLISMAKATVGPIGQIIAWLTYLLLLYSLMCAYVAGGSDLFHNLFALANFQFPSYFAVFGFTIIFGLVVCLGIHITDYVNRGLMIIKLSAFFLLVGLLMPFISVDKLVKFHGINPGFTTALMVTITSFGFSAIVPSLRIYFAGDNRRLKQAIIFGSLVPLICYIFWDMVIMGIIPFHGANGLASIMQSQGEASGLVNSLNANVSQGLSAFFVKLFTSISVVTSFLGVALCLSDFLADGMQVEKKGQGAVYIYALTFLPPLVIVFFNPGIFVQALKYAGIYCVILQILLPAWIVWSGRYKKRIASGFAVPGGKWLLSVMVIIGAGLLLQTLCNQVF
jgi:tyrosine-specific transport protein